MLTSARPAAGLVASRRPSKAARLPAPPRVASVEPPAPGAARAAGAEANAWAPPRAPTLPELVTPQNLNILSMRMAMMGMAAGSLGELLTQRPIVAQALSAPGAVAAAAALLAVASAAPLLAGEREGEEVFGPFEPKAEKLNGKLAMVGLLALVAIEAVKGSALL